MSIKSKVESPESQIEHIEFESEQDFDWIENTSISDVGRINERKSEYGFENLAVWQKSRALARVLYETTSAGAFCKDRALQSQMRRAVISIVSNLAEGAERTSSKEFAHFISLAKGSCAELRAQLIVCYDIGHIVDKEQFSALIHRAEEVSRMLGGLLTSVRGRHGNKTL